MASAGFTESKVLAQMFSLLLNKAGFSAPVTDVTSSEQFQSSLEKGTIGVVPEYVATYADQLNTIINGAEGGVGGFPLAVHVPGRAQGAGCTAWVERARTHQRCRPERVRRQPRRTRRNTI